MSPRGGGAANTARPTRPVSFQLALAMALVVGVVSGARGEVTLVEDWAQHAVGATGVPAGWTKYATLGGRARYELEVTQLDGQRALRLTSRDEHTTIAKGVRVDLRATPFLEWSWKVARLPAGADIRARETSDLTAHLFVVWQRTPSLIRSRLIGYVWDGLIPAGSIEPSRKTRLVTFVVARSGSGDLHRWVVERRNVADDYRRVFGEEPDAPTGVAISIDTNDTHSVAEAVIGRIAFTSDTGSAAAPSPVERGTAGSR